MKGDNNEYFVQNPLNGEVHRLRRLIPHSTPYLDQNDINAVTEVIKSGFIASGSKASEFEDRLTEYLAVKGCFVTNSGTSALHLALLALGLGKGDSVLLPSLVCYAVLDAVNHTGAKPLFVDVDPDSYNISVRDVKDNLYKRPKAIIVPHLYGQAADVEGIVKLGIPVVEDCSQALGAEVNGKRVGSIGDISTFSFYATKIIATGAGGAVASNSDSLLEKVRDIGSNYYKKDYRVRYNYRMSDLQASIGISQLDKLGLFLDRRRFIAKKYSEGFMGLNIQQPFIKEDRSHIYYRYMVRIPCKCIGNNRDDYIKYMKDRGVVCSTPDIPLHRFAGLTPDEFPNTEWAYNSAISIPIYPYLSDSEVEYITGSFRQTCCLLQNNEV